MKILLVEPDYKNKYPPIGLMKISTYHKLKGDDVTFVKGKNKEIQSQKWDRIYITTLFTFYWNKTVDTIKYYLKASHHPRDIMVGGILASIMGDELLKEPRLAKINVYKGLLDRPGILGDDDYIVDNLSLDYSILDSEYCNYVYPEGDSYYCYATRGCIRKCKFCVVPTIEPNFNNFISVKKQIEDIRLHSGNKRHLKLMDNNILASDRFNEIIDEIKECGFSIGDNKYTYQKNNRSITVHRFVDFNQGVDARLMTEEKVKKMGEIAIKPLRIAFDYANDQYVKLYIEKVRLAIKHGIRDLSNYVLYNYEDTPEDLYKRLEINIKLNQEYYNEDSKDIVRIFSFPMKYSPITGDDSKHRKYIGTNWSWKEIRSIQCILNSTHGVVGPKSEYFYKAFGKDINEFKKLLLMPEEYIIYRIKNEQNGYTEKWWKDYCSLQLNDKNTLSEIFKIRNFQKLDLKVYNKAIQNILHYYL